MRFTMDPRPSLARFGPALTVVVGLGLLAVVAQPGCADKTCTPSDGDNTTPGPAFECAAGEVCYLGKCITTCSAGAELAEKCSASDDCGGARPNCVRTFCSSCESAETCVPTLNICQPVTEVVLPEPVERPDRPQEVPRPLDAGFTPGGVVRPERDGGLADQPEDREVTRVAFIDLGRRLDVSSPQPAETAVASVRAFNTAIGAGNGLKWRADTDPPKVEEAFPDPDQVPGAPRNTIDEFCELRQLRTVSGPGGSATPANIGDIRMGNPADFPDSIRPELSAVFQGGAYVVTPTPTSDFLTFSVSVPTEPHFVFVSGEPLTNVVTFPWPDVADFGHHIPFELRPTPATLNEMQGGFRVASPAAQDLVFRYARIETGNDGFEAVFVRVTGQQTELFCEQREGRGLGGEIRVRAAILDAFRLAEGLTQAGTYELVFERASRELIQPRATPNQLVLITVRVRHSLTTPIVFE